MLRFVRLVVMETILRVRNLSKQFGHFNAVTDLSFSVEKGDVYGFLGQNGAGKSTTIRMLLTLITPRAGSIEMFGMPLATHRHEILRKVGAVIERPDLYKYLSAYENLHLFASMSGVSVKQQRLMEQLEMVGLAERAHSKVRTFSQGMKQRLGLAIALVHDPELIVLDEPTNGLDPQGIADMRNLILMLSKQMNKTVLVSSHLLSEIEQIANRMLIIDKGIKLVEGSVQALFNTNDMVLHLHTTNDAATHGLLLQSEYAARLMQADEAGIQIRMSKNEVPQLVQWLVAREVQVLSVEPHFTLEDYFLKITTANQHVEPFTH